MSITKKKPIVMTMYWSEYNQEYGRKNHNPKTIFSSTLTRMTSGSYYDINSILMEEEIIPVSWSLDQKELGYLAKKGGDPLVSTSRFFSLQRFYPFKLKRNTPVKLPLWAVQQLSDTPDFQCLMPDKYSTSLREHNLADPTNVSLNESPFYYQVGKQVASLPYFINDYLIQTLFTMWASRYQILLLHSHNYHHSEDKAIIDRLCLEEKESFVPFYNLFLSHFPVFTSANNQMNLTHQWHAHQLGKLLPSLLSLDKI